MRALSPTARALPPATLDRLIARHARWRARGRSDLLRGVGLVVAGFAVILITLIQPAVEALFDGLLWQLHGPLLAGLIGAFWGVLLLERGVFAMAQAQALRDALAEGAVRRAMVLASGAD